MRHPNAFGGIWTRERAVLSSMPWQKDHPRHRGELEFHFANETAVASEERIRQALERRERRHAHHPHERG